MRVRAFHELAGRGSTKTRTIAHRMLATRSVCFELFTDSANFNIWNVSARGLPYHFL